MSHKSCRVATELVLASTLGISAAAAPIGSAAANIINTVGLTEVTAPSLVTGDFIVNQGPLAPRQIIFYERQQVLLNAPLIMDTGIIAAGTLVDSYFLALNSNTDTHVNTSVTFDQMVLGITFSDVFDPYNHPNAGINPLFLSSNFLGAQNTTYSLASCTFCGFEVETSPDFDKASFAGSTASFEKLLPQPRRLCPHHHCCSTCPRPHRRRWTARPDLGMRRSASHSRGVGRRARQRNPHTPKNRGPGRPPKFGRGFFFLCRRTVKARSKARSG